MFLQDCGTSFIDITLETFLELIRDFLLSIDDQNDPNDQSTLHGIMKTAFMNVIQNSPTNLNTMHMLKFS